MADDVPDYAGIAARATQDEYQHASPPEPRTLPARTPVLERQYWPFGKDLERYLEIKGVKVPASTKSISLHYERDDNIIRVTIKMKHGEKLIRYISAPLIDNMEAMDT